MASAIADQESVLRQSVIGLLELTGHGATSSGQVETAIASALGVFHSAAAQYAGEFNRTRPHCNWDRLPAELKLEVVRRLPLSHRAKMLGISHDMRALVLSDPSLWTTISPPALGGDARAAFLRTMLARSGNCPVEIFWIDRWDFKDSFPEPPRAAIVRAVPRARTLDLDVSYFAPERDWFWSSSAPLLVRLTVRPQTAPECTISPDTWAGSVVQSLRELSLPTITIDGPPRSPFASVVSLRVNLAVSTRGIEWIWDWFPHVQKLAVCVCGADAPLIPPPPAGLRHVVLYRDNYCSNALRVLGGWRTHCVRLIEVYDQYDAPEAGLAFLDPAGPCSAAFTPACQPRGGRHNATVIRSGAMTIAVWSDSPYYQRLQLHTPGLLDRVEALTLGEGVLESAFREDVAFPVLRSLTLVSMSEAGSIVRRRDQTMRAPALEQLIFDLASEPPALALLPALVARIMADDTRMLREIVIRLPNDFDRLSPAIGEVSAELAPMASNVRVEFHSAARCRQHPCFCSAL